VFFGGSFIIRVILLLQPTHPWWDASVYQAMARYIGSGGVYGTWELFRPPFWPLLLSICSHTSPTVLEWIAKIITLAASLGTIYLVYKIGKKIDPWVGTIATAILSISVPFLTFSVVPMTEIPSLFLVTLATYLFIEQRLFLAGLLAGLAFATRFPTGLIIGVFGIVTILYHFDYLNLKNSIITIIRQGIILLLGFCTIIVPLFISNYYLYGSVTLPLTVGQGMITGFMWLYQGGWLFYVKKIISMNLIVLFIIPIISLLVIDRKKISLVSKKIILLCIVMIIIFLGYFTMQPHKEFRYILPIYPSLFILASIGMVWLGKRLPISRVLITGIIIIFIIGSTRYIVSMNSTPVAEIRQFYNFYTALDRVPVGSRVITSTPTITAFSPVTLYEGYNSWEQIDQVYEKNKLQADYVAIDSCELHACEPGQELECKNDQTRFLKKLSQESKLVYTGKTNICNLMIYQLHISR
jgi:hypothetical protein